MDYVERRVTSQDNLSLYLRDYGSAADPRPPVVCLGGLTRNCKDFAALAERVSADRRRVICPDYRGRGRSQYDPDWHNYEPRVYIRDLQAILAALDVHRIVIVGTSLGGILGMAMGAAAPASLAGVVLNDIGPVVETVGLDHIVNYIREDRPHRTWDEAVVTIKNMLPNLTFQDESVWLKMAQNTFREGEDGRLHFDWDVNVVKPMLKSAYEVPDMWLLYNALRRIPVLALRGAQSDILSPATFDAMAAAKPDLVRVLVPNAGHVPTLAEPESRAALDAFLAAH